MLDEILRKSIDTLAAPQRFPESTYRLQFHAGFTFRDATKILPYLRELGVTHVYASPYLKARAGSTHGYDVIDHGQLNPEIGTEEEYATFLDALRQQGLHHILDIVPNHAGVATNENKWWNDVLENGLVSPYARYFDIAWRGSPRPELHDKLLLPVLGDPYGDVLERGQLQLKYENGAFAVYYYDRRFPINPLTYGTIFRNDIDEAGNISSVGSALADVFSVQRTPSASDEADPTSATQSAEIKHRLADLVARDRGMQHHIQQTLAALNGAPGEPRSFDALDDLLNAQHYRLAYWRTAADEINYRRFFDVNELAALCMERLDVFQAAHARTLRWLGEGKVAGLRIDHPDGLYDPKEYFLRLQRYAILATARALVETDPQFRGTKWEEIEPQLPQRLTSEIALRDPSARRWPLYVVAEKILAAGEPLPEDWAIHGTSGYDFLNMVNGLFVNEAAAGSFTQLYQDFTNDPASFGEIACQCKRLILQISLASELQMLARQLDRLAQKDRHSRDFTLIALHDALRGVIACFPVYRSYISEEGVRDIDVRYITRAIDDAIQRNPKIDPAVFHFIRDTLLLRYRSEHNDELRQEQIQFAGKFQQVTAPVTAKGIEDTAFYRFNRLVSLNEVGGEPGRFGLPPEELHTYFFARQRQWPYALSCLSTHDTKRSEDVRARLNVLSELPDEWRQVVTRWSRLNEPHRQFIDGLAAPGPNEEYLLYQTLVGAWPPESGNNEAQAQFVRRIQAYMEKALHEAKVRTSWTHPNPAYDRAIAEFIARILDEQTSAQFLQDLRAFQRRISHYGALNSLSQTLLRLTAPGVPDTYQGTELPDFSLVDPDNRRPVDYGKRQQMLRDLRSGFESAGSSGAGFAREVMQNIEDGRAKLLVTWKALRLRRQFPGLFSAGEYLPLLASGAKAAHVFAFQRRHEGQTAIVAVPRFFTRLTKDMSHLPVGPEVWDQTILPVAANHGDTFQNAFTSERVAIQSEGGAAALDVSDLFAHFPVALLVSGL